MQNIVENFVWWPPMNHQRFHVYAGGPAGLASAPTVTVDVPGYVAYQPIRIGATGDLNGDGHNDLVAGWPNTADPSTATVGVLCGGTQGAATMSVVLDPNPVTETAPQRSFAGYNPRVPPLTCPAP